MIHELKIIPKYFKQILSAEKTFEIRKNDRNYQENDILILKEFNQETKIFTGSYVKCKVISIVKDSDFPEGIKSGYCIMSLDLQEIKLPDSHRYISTMIFSSRANIGE